MAKDKIQNGQHEFGTVHVMEQEMREAEQGVYEPKSGESGTRRARTAAKKPETISSEGVTTPAKTVAKKG
jgi:hypothetical protein